MLGTIVAEAASLPILPSELYGSFGVADPPGTLSLTTHQYSVLYFTRFIDMWERDFRIQKPSFATESFR